MKAFLVFFLFSIQLPVICRGSDSLSIEPFVGSWKEIGGNNSFTITEDLQYIQLFQNQDQRFAMTDPEGLATGVWSEAKGCSYREVKKVEDIVKNEFFGSGVEIWLRATNFELVSFDELSNRDPQCKVLELERRKQIFFDEKKYILGRPYLYSIRITGFNDKGQLMQWDPFTRTEVAKWERHQIK